MGLWNWIVSQITEPPGTTPGRRSPSGSMGSQGVAVADRPLDKEREQDDQPSEKWWAPAGATLTEPPPVQRPDLSTEARAVENLLVSHFDGHDLSLPPLMHVAESVLPRLRDTNADLGQVVSDLSSDQVIATAILRMANSPLYRGLNKITAIRPAVSRLGFKALRTLLIHESMRAVMFGRKGGANELARMVWRQSLASACIMRGLSKFTAVDEEQAFLTGLLHDIGNVVVLRIVRGDDVALRYEIDLDTFDYLCYESHQEFGELIADAWRLPPDLKALILDHHGHPAPDDPLRIERLQLQLTDMICAMLGYAPSVSYNLLESYPVAELGLADRDDFLVFLDELPGEVEEAVEAL